MDPGIHDINSNPDTLLFFANSETFCCVAAAPAIIISLFNNEILEKLLPNLIIVP